MYSNTKNQKVVVDLCVSSSIATGVSRNIENHTGKLLIKNKIPVTINTDDPAILDIDLLEEFKKLKKAWKLKISDFKQIYKTSILSAFCNTELKEYLLGF